MHSFCLPCPNSRRKPLYWRKAEPRPLQGGAPPTARRNVCDRQATSTQEKFSFETFLLCAARDGPCCLFGLQVCVKVRNLCVDGLFDHYLVGKNPRVGIMCRALNAYVAGCGRSLPGPGVEGEPRCGVLCADLLPQLPEVLPVG